MIIGLHVWRLFNHNESFFRDDLLLVSPDYSINPAQRTTPGPPQSCNDLLLDRSLHCSDHFLRYA